MHEFYTITRIASIAVTFCMSLDSIRCSSFKNSTQYGFLNLGLIESLQEGLTRNTTLGLQRGAREDLETEEVVKAISYPKEL